MEIYNMSKVYFEHLPLLEYIKMRRMPCHFSYQLQGFVIRPCSYHGSGTNVDMQKIAQKDYCVEPGF